MRYCTPIERRAHASHHALWLALLLAAAPTAILPARAAAPSSEGTEPANPARDGTFKAVTGEVTMVRGTSRSAVVVGDGVSRGDVLLSGPESAAAITLRDDTALVIGAQTRLEITQFDYRPTQDDGELLLGLRRGTLRVIPGSLTRHAHGDVKIVTPTAVVGAGAADFIVEQAP